MIRIIDPGTNIECPEGTAGEIWVHGGNVAMGYWQKPQRSVRTETTCRPQTLGLAWTSVISPRVVNFV
jgi:acyl-CoA synthetase (AMP-forming)/AMP-acid ligase II